MNELQFFDFMCLEDRVGWDSFWLPFIAMDIIKIKTIKTPTITVPKLRTLTGQPNL